jgi:hypothetical protein
VSDQDSPQEATVSEKTSEKDTKPETATVLDTENPGEMKTVAI